MKILDKESDSYVLDQWNLINQGIRVIVGTEFIGCIG